MTKYMIRFCSTLADRHSGYWIPMAFPEGTTLEEIQGVARRVHESEHAVQVYEECGTDAQGRLRIKPVGPELINAEK